MQDDKPVITVVGCGQVGFRTCILFAGKGYQVFAADIDTEKVNKLNAGISPFNDDPYLEKFTGCKGSITASTDVSGCCAKSDFVLVCVPTPLKQKSPDLTFLQNATRDIASGLTRGATVIYESTVHPGVIKRLIPILESSGLKLGEFGVAHCPERMDPGNRKFDIENTPRVIGASDRLTLQKAKSLYEDVMSAPLYEVSNIETAEACKLVENTFRDVNIAFVNELATVFADTEIDVKEVIDAAATKPFAFLAHKPGPGVGGECIPISPHWLMEFARTRGKEMPLVRKARDVNESMPAFVVGRLKNLMAGKGSELNGSSVLLLGLGYKPDSSDTRISPSRDIIRLLKQEGASICGCDPLLDNKMITEGFDIEPAKADSKADAAILVTAHNAFDRKMTKDLKVRFFLDACNRFAKNDFDGIEYAGLG
ncbi:MAG: nucleotide sugar dehydrogenase [Candidatus Aenigmatarchaeota archaeon]